MYSLPYKWTNKISHIFVVVVNYINHTEEAYAAVQTVLTKNVIEIIPKTYVCLLLLVLNLRLKKLDLPIYCFYQNCVLSILSFNIHGITDWINMVGRD